MIFLEGFSPWAIFYPTGSVGPFVIDSSTGYLSTNAAIVYTDQSSYSLTVTGTDSGGLTGTASVTVNVIEGMLTE